MKKRMSVEQAVAVVDDDLPDGAWMARLCELTGLDAGDVSAELARLSDHGRKELVDGRFVENSSPPWDSVWEVEAPPNE